MSTIIQVSVVDGSQNKKTSAHNNFMLPAHWDLTLSDNALVSVYCFIKNFIGASGGTSTVAIDNKIEQAMDLVKSHLMFAVREEVDVLKEKITELMDRISQLEYENGFLRANASQETLNQLTQAQQLQQQQQQQQQQQPQTTTITSTPLQQQQLQQQPQIVNLSQQQNIQKQQPAS